MVKHDFVLIPSSKMKLAITRILKREGFVKDYEVLKDKSHRVIKVYLKYGDKNEPVLAGLELSLIHI